MPEYYTKQALAKLDEAIEEAESRFSAAMLSMGDDSGSSETWHDNPIFDQAKHDVAMTSYALSRLRDIRAQAKEIEANEHVDTIRVGSTVKVEIIDSADEVEVATYHIAGGYVAARELNDDVFDLSTSSPLGSALIGKRQGDTIAYKLPNGRTQEAVILSIIS